MAIYKRDLEITDLLLPRTAVGVGIELEGGGGWGVGGLDYNSSTLTTEDAVSPKSTRVYTAFLFMGHAFWKKNI